MSDNNTSKRAQKIADRGYTLPLVLTCKVTFNYYDYNKMPYGSMYNDRESYLASGVSQSIGTDTMRENIAKVQGFTKLSAGDLKMMLPDSTWAGIPIDVATGTSSGSAEITNLAAIQRWDCAWDNPTAADPMAVSPTQVTWTANAVHGIDAGATYAWRIDIASQQNIMFDIGNSTNITPGTANYNWIAHQLQDKTSPLYMNDPGAHNIASGIEFRNQVGDLKWDGDAIFTGTLIATGPSGTPMTISLFGEGKGVNTPTYSKFAVNFPTDPKEAILQIQAVRIFSVRTWVWDNTYSRYLSKFWMRKMVKLTGQTRVRVIDKLAPVLEEDYTWPRNIFAMTGGKIAAGEGPAGHANPASLSVVMSDDNQWECGNDNGVTLTTSQTNSTDNANIRKTAGRNSTKNLKPVFSKDRRGISVQFELANDST